MLTKVKTNGKYLIYRRGIGYLYRLNALINGKNINNLSESDLIWVLKNYTNIKHPMLFVYISGMKKALEIVKKVIEFNTDPEKSRGGKTTNPEDALTAVVDILASQYGWDLDYILSTIDIFQARELVKMIRKRQENENMVSIMIAHDPQGIIKAIEKSNGVERMSWEDAEKMLKEETNGKQTADC